MAKGEPKYGVCRLCKHYHAIKVLDGMGQCNNWHEIQTKTGGMLKPQRNTAKWYWPSMYDPNYLATCEYAQEA